MTDDLLHKSEFSLSPAKRKRRKRIKRAFNSGRALSIAYALLYGLMAFTVFAGAGFIAGGIPLMICSSFAGLGEAYTEVGMMWRSAPGVVVDITAGDYIGQGLLEYYDDEGHRHKFTRKQKFKLFGAGFFSIAAGLTSAVIVSTHAVATLAFLGVAGYFFPYLLGLFAVLVAVTMITRMLKSSADLIRDPNTKKNIIEFFKKLHPDHPENVKSGKSRTRIWIESALYLTVLVGTSFLIMLGVFALGFSAQTIAAPVLAHALHISPAVASAITGVIMIGGTMIGRFAFQIKSAYYLVNGSLENAKNIWNKINNKKNIFVKIYKSTKAENLNIKKLSNGNPASIIATHSEPSVTSSEPSQAVSAETTTPLPPPKTWGEFFYQVGTNGGIFALRAINATVATIIASENALRAALSYCAMTGAGLRAYSALSIGHNEIIYNPVIDDVVEPKNVEVVVDTSLVTSDDSNVVKTDRPRK